jgi:hypothetical protein
LLAIFPGTFSLLWEKQSTTGQCRRQTEMAPWLPAYWACLDTHACTHMHLHVHTCGPKPNRGAFAGYHPLSSAQRQREPLRLAGRVWLARRSFHGARLFCLSSRLVRG